jgi:hypothetical protein
MELITYENCLYSFIAAKYHIPKGRHCKESLQDPERRPEIEGVRALVFKPNFTSAKSRAALSGLGLYPAN